MVCQAGTDGTLLTAVIKLQVCFKGLADILHNNPYSLVSVMFIFIWIMISEDPNMGEQSCLFQMFYF